MRVHISWFNKVKQAVLLCMILLWVCHLVRTDGYFSSYALCCVFAAVCLFENCHSHNRLQGKKFVAAFSISFLLSLASVMGNYPIFQRVRNLNEISSGTNAFLNIFEFGLTLVCGIAVFYQIILYAFSLSGKLHLNPQSCSDRKKPKAVFLCAVGSTWLIYLIYLFLVTYPGSVSGDSVWQIIQGYNNSYQNNHPVWHTLMIKVLMQMGGSIFGNSNAAVATYSAVQGLFLACCFGYAVVTLYQIGVPCFWIVVSYFIYTCMPYNITYSATMWKDVPFGASMLLFVVALFRIVRDVGEKKKWNYMILFAGGLGVCTMRTNGLAALFAASIVMVPLLWKGNKKVIYSLSAILVAGWVLTNPVFMLMNVGETPFVEVLSIPAQQLSRVITYGGELTEYESEMLGKVVDLDEIPLIYDELVADPIKDEILLTDPDYLRAHISEYGKIWIKVGLRYPGEYLKAWIEQTKGYWNGGYDYYIYAEYVSDNEFGIYMVPQRNIVFKLVKAYFTFSRETVIFEPLQSIGLHVWMLVILWLTNVLHRRKEALLFAPCFIIIAGLMLGAPVYSQFRYAYPVFTSIPFLAPVTFFSEKKNVNKI